MLGVGSGEIVMIIILAILVFGPKKLPELARNAGKFMADIRKATGDLKKNFEEELGVGDLNDLDPRKIAGRYITESDIIDSAPKETVKPEDLDYDDSIYPDEKDESEDELKSASNKDKDKKEDSK